MKEIQFGYVPHFLKVHLHVCLLYLDCCVSLAKRKASSALICFMPTTSVWENTLLGVPSLS